MNWRGIILLGGILVIILAIALTTFVWFWPSPSETVVEEIKIPYAQHRVIGQSVEGRDIKAYTFGQGETRLLFVGGIHGGYEWNSVALAYQFIDYLTAHPDFVPANLTLAIIPSANPDGVYRVTKQAGRFTLAEVTADQSILEAGRFNAHKVDLNRNFACKWQAKSTWREAVVSAGSEAFSEPEAVALRDFILDWKPRAVVFWHSQANAVYASECEAGILPETLKLVDVYAQASGYEAVKSFDQYVVTGDAEGWLASINIPAITVELKTHQDIEWEKNLAGLKALVEYYNQ